MRLRFLDTSGLVERGKEQTRGARKRLLRQRRRGGKESKKVKVDARMNEGKRTAKRGERKNEERYEEKSFITKGRTDKEASLLFINYVQVRERESKGTAFEREGREILRS